MNGETVLGPIISTKSDIVIEIQNNEGKSYQSLLTMPSKLYQHNK
jgi:hypothetical protein